MPCIRAGKDAVCWVNGHATMDTCCVVAVISARREDRSLQQNVYAGPLENVNPVFREVWSGGVRGSAPIAAQGTWVCWAPAEPIRAHPQSP